MTHSSAVSVELLPCPFCGSPARTDLLPHAHGPGWVQCSACECDQHMSDTLEEAVTRWNTRASLQPATPVEAARAREPFAWRCCDDRYPYIYGIVTDRQTTVDSWRESNITFQPLYADVAQPSSYRSDVEIALREIRRYCDENLGPSRSSLLSRIANIADAALAIPSTDGAGK